MNNAPSLAGSPGIGRTPGGSHPHPKSNKKTPTSGFFQNWRRDGDINNAPSLASSPGIGRTPGVLIPIPKATKKTHRAVFIHGGEMGIRTPDTVTRIHAFQACSLNHSDTSPVAPIIPQNQINPTPHTFFVPHKSLN